jgi:hypothetical protein
MAHPLPVVEAAAEGAPDTTDPGALAAVCTKWRLDPQDANVVAFLDFYRRDGTRWVDWSAAWRTRTREANRPVAKDELDEIDVPALTTVGLVELGMPEMSATYGLAPATVARIAGRTVTIAMTLVVAGLRAPAVREKIRAARRAAQAKAAESDEGVAAKAAPTTSGAGA